MSDRTYQVQYWSASKGAFQAINEMPTPHLRNAIQKMKARLAYMEQEPVPAVEPQQPGGDVEVLEAMMEELAEREADIQAEAHAENAHAEMVAEEKAKPEEYEA